MVTVSSTGDPSENPPALAEELAALRERVQALEAENAGLRQQARTRAEQGTPRLDALASKAFRLLVEHGTDVIWTADLSLRPLYLSPATERLRGYSVEETLAQPIDQILTPASLQRARDLLRRVRRSGRGRLLEDPIEMEVTHRDGHTLWTESMVTLLKDPHGRPAGFIGISRDISERRRFQQALRERNELLETIFSSLQQIFFSLSTDPLRVEHISPACQEIYGIPADEFLLDPMNWIAPVLEEDQPRLQAGFRALLRGDRQESVAEYRIRKPDGTVRWMRSQTRSRRDAHGKVTHLFGFVADITAQKDLESQLVQAQKMEAVGTLAGGMAHDMNNVLGVIMGLASVLETRLAKDPALYKQVKGILDATRRGRSLTKNLLGFARKGCQRTELVNLNSLVEDMLDLLERTVPKSVVLSTRLQGTLDPVLGDPDQYHLALINLCLNACDAMPDGGTLTLSTRNLAIRSSDESLAGAPPGRYVEVRVQDTGVGMDEEARARAFEPFYTTKPPGQGTGLGLSIVYATVQAADGYVQIHSHPGSGTTVLLLLPAQRHTPPPPPPHPVLSETATAAPPTPGALVLVVDDEPLFRHTAELMLAELGYRCACVDSGEQALDWLADPAHTDVSGVLLDLQMPGMGGRETYHALRANHPRLPVVFCSGYSGGDRQEDLLRLGAAGYLRKPFELSELDALLSRVLPRP